MKPLLQHNTNLKNKQMKKNAFNFILLAGLVISLSSCSNDDDKNNIEEKETSVLSTFASKTRINQDDLTFGELAKGVNGESITISTVTGSFQGGGFHGTFFKIPKGEATVPHAHTNNYHAIVIKGIIENPIVGDLDTKQIKAGGFWYQPANEEHSTKCSKDSEEDCLVYLYQDSPFDFDPVKDDK